VPLNTDITVVDSLGTRSFLNPDKARMEQAPMPRAQPMSIAGSIGASQSEVLSCLSVGIQNKTGKS
jgi:hypothetical protein